MTRKKTKNTVWSRFESGSGIESPGLAWHPYFFKIVAQFDLMNCHANCRPIGLKLATLVSTCEVSCDLIFVGSRE